MTAIDTMFPNKPTGVMISGMAFLVINANLVIYKANGIDELIVLSLSSNCVLLNAVVHWEKQWEKNCHFLKYLGKFFPK